MIDTQAIRSKILDLAIRGQLSEQLPEDGSANDLFLEIMAKKQGQISAGIIKKEKQLPEIAEEEQPFCVPESWKWVRLGNLLRVISGVSYEKSDVSSGGLRILRGGNIQDVGIELDSSDVFLPLSYYDDDKMVRKGDVIIVASTGSETAIGRAGYVDKEYDNVMIGAFLRICRPIIPSISLYLRSIFMSNYYRQHIRHESKGTNINNIKENYITHFIVPLPPIAEQNRIVEKIKQAFLVLDTIDALQAQYADNLTVLKSKLIDAAIQGKLTEQLSEDGTAEELYQQIQAEKAALEKAGKIKKSKPLPPVAEEEKPFEIPESWKWVRIGNVINEVIVPQRDKPPFSGDIPWCRIEDKDGYFLNGTKSGQFVSKETIDKMNLRVFPIGTVLSACSGASIGTILINTVECCTNQTFNGLVCSNGLFNWYLFWYLKSAISKLQSMGTGSAMAYVSQEKIRSMIIPLPPLAEQKRIVETLNKALIVID